MQISTTISDSSGLPIANDGKVVTQEGWEQTNTSLEFSKLVEDFWYPLPQSNKALLCTEGDSCVLKNYCMTLCKS